MDETTSWGPNFEGQEGYKICEENSCCTTPYNSEYWSIEDWKCAYIEDF
jgi:hypothetical protein